MNRPSTQLSLKGNEASPFKQSYYFNKYSTWSNIKSKIKDNISLHFSRVHEIRVGQEWGGEEGWKFQTQKTRTQNCNLILGAKLTWWWWWCAAMIIRKKIIRECIIFLKISRMPKAITVRKRNRFLRRNNAHRILGEALFVLPSSYNDPYEGPVDTRRQSIYCFHLVKTPTLQLNSGLTTSLHPWVFDERNNARSAFNVCVNKLCWRQNAHR